MNAAPYHRDLRVNYPPDGTARDTYVQSGNGGLAQPYSPVKYPAVTTFATRQNFNPPSPLVKPRGVYY